MSTRVDIAQVNFSMTGHEFTPASRINLIHLLTGLLQIPFEPETLASVAVADSVKDWKGDVKGLGVFEDAFEVKGKHQKFSCSANASVFVCISTHDVSLRYRAELSTHQMLNSTSAWSSSFLPAEAPTSREQAQSFIDSDLILEVIVPDVLHVPPVSCRSLPVYSWLYSCA